MFGAAMLPVEPGSEGVDGSLVWFGDLKNALFEKECFFCRL